MFDLNIDWNFIDLMKRQRSQYVFDKEFQAYFKELINFKGGEKILDVGCGIGTVPKLLHNIYGNKCEIHGVDINPNLIEWGRKNWGKSKNIELVIGDAHALKFPDQFFDLVCSFGLLECLEDPLSAIDEMVRVKGTGGRIVTLSLETGRFYKYPESDEEKYFYKEYLKGLEKKGCIVGDEGKRIQKLFLKRNMVTTRSEHVFEIKYEITEQLLSSWNTPTSTHQDEQTRNAYVGFYYQFFKALGWTLEKFQDLVQKGISWENEIKLFEKHIGEVAVVRSVLSIVVT